MKALIIGDSHTLRLRHPMSDRGIEDCSWGPNDVPITSKCIQNHSGMTTNFKYEIYFSGHRGKTGYRGSFYENDAYPCLEKYKSEDFLILPWFGYIDVKQFLPMEGFKNPKEAVISYVDKTINYFKNNKIKFIEPLPQFMNILGFGSPLFPFEDREPYQKDFIKYLREECKLRGLEEPISIESMLGVDKFDESYECYVCNDCLDPKHYGIKLDHPNPETFLKISKGLIKEIDLTISKMI
jgi:hypothetical protein